MDIDTICYVNGKLVPKSEATVSLYDSGFQHGDGIYEGIRCYDGRVFMLDEHIERLFESAKAIDIDMGITPGEMREIVLKTIRANSIQTNLHMRLQVTRGRKTVTGMNPKLSVEVPTIVICVDYKEPIFSKKGVRLITSTFKRTRPDFLDPKVHTCNQLGQILANIEANRQGADEAIMLDPNGFVAETNGTTLFMVKDGVVNTPTTDYILVGITRGIIMKLAKDCGYPVVERNISLSEFYNADEVFMCGTVGEIVPVAEIDRKKIGTSVPGTHTSALMEKYRAMTDQLGIPVN